MIAGMILAGVIFAAGMVILISTIVESVKSSRKEKDKNGSKKTK